MSKLGIHSVKQRSRILKLVIQATNLQIRNPKVRDQTANLHNQMLKFVTRRSELRSRITKLGYQVFKLAYRVLKQKCGIS